MKRVTDLVSEIAVASREQAMGIDQVNVAVSQMDAVTQQNAALVEESSIASRALRTRAAELQEEIAFFRVETRGHASAPTAPSRPAPAASPTPTLRAPATPARAQAARPAAQRHDVEEWAEF